MHEARSKNETALRFWEERYAKDPELGSGAGSKGVWRRCKLDAIERALKRHPIRRVVDLGCGDLQVLRELPTLAELDYVGVDFVAEVVARNRVAFPHLRFVHADLANLDTLDLAPADLVLCLDVLFHIPDDEAYRGVCRYLFNSGARAVILTGTVGHRESNGVNLWYRDFWEEARHAGVGHVGFSERTFRLPFERLFSFDLVEPGRDQPTEIIYACTPDRSRQLRASITTLLRSGSSFDRIVVFWIGEEPCPRFADSRVTILPSRRLFGDYVFGNKSYLCTRRAERVVFLDTDTFVLRPIELSWNEHDAEFLARVGRAYRDERWNPAAWRQGLASVGVKGEVPMYNCGLLVFQNGAHRRLTTDWEAQIWRYLRGELPPPCPDMRMPEQWALAQALAKHAIRQSRLGAREHTFGWCEDPTEETIVLHTGADLYDQYYGTLEADLSVTNLDALAPSPIVVTGMHGSATSLAAALVAGLGVNLGERLLAADAHNPAGYFEDLDFVELQSRMMLAATPADDGGHPDWGWTEHSWLDPQTLEPRRDDARALIATRVAGGRPWGWKNPRTAVALEFWDSLLNEARYLFTYRYPWEVADSLQRLGAEVFLRNPHYAYSIWELYNRRILKFLSRARDRCLLVSANALLSDPDRLDGLLRDRLGLAAPDGYVRSHIRPDLFRSAGPGEDPLVTLLEAVRPDCLDLLQELDRQADLSSAGLWGAPPRAIWCDGSGARPRVSVLVPCYNQGEFLLEAVASVERAAREEPLELVVVDDGSDEPWTLQVLEALRRLGYRVLNQENRGLAAARNAGAAIASGDFLLPLDADDRLRPEFPAAARDALEAEPDVGVVYCDYWEFGLRSGHVRAPDFDLPRLLRGNYVAACACLRRRVWEECGGWDEALSAWEDWELWISAAERGWWFRRFPGIGFDYRRRPDSLVQACLRAEAGEPLQAHIVRKHQAVYLRYLPELLINVQDAVREADAARQELANALSRLEEAAAQRDHLAGRIASQEAEIGRASAREARLEQERDRLYGELAAWRERVAFMEETFAWRMRRRLLALKRAR